MSSFPGADLEDFLAWSYDLAVLGQEDANPSMRLAESLGTSIKVRPHITEEEFKELVSIFEPIRNTVEDLLLDFNEDSQSWRDYAQRFESYIPYHMTRKATSWMISKGYWKKEEMKVIDLPNEYPLLISGAASTYKTTMALMIAYQEALNDRYNPTDIIIVSKELSLEHIPLILSRYIKDFDINKFTEDNKKNSILFHVTDSSNFKPKGDPNNQIFIFDEPTLTIPLSGHRNYETVTQGFQSLLKDYTNNGSKCIICSYMPNGQASGNHEPDGTDRCLVILDFNARSVCKTFAFTSPGSIPFPVSDPLHIHYLDKFPVNS